MKKALFIFFFINTIIACNKKILPVIERRTEEPPAPKVEINLAAGQKLFTTGCARCHDLPKTSKYNSNQWDPVLSLMIPRAGLSGSDAVSVRAYVKANAAQ